MPYTKRSIRDFKHLDLTNDPKKEREREWILRFLALNSIDKKESIYISFGRDNPKMQEDKDPDFLIEIRDDTIGDSFYSNFLEKIFGAKSFGIELVSAYSRDSKSRTSRNPHSDFPKSTDEWSATQDQWEQALRKEIRNKFKNKYYSRNNFEKLILLVCDETNGKDHLFDGHKYINGYCHIPIYDPRVSGTPYSRLTSIQRCGDGLLKINNAGFDDVMVLTRRGLSEDDWVLSGMNLQEQHDYANIVLLKCNSHDPIIRDSAFGLIGYSGPVKH